MCPACKVSSNLVAKLEAAEKVRAALGDAIVVVNSLPDLRPYRDEPWFRRMLESAAAWESAGVDK